MKRENVIGRANVEDTPELEKYYRDLDRESLGALWTVANEIEPWHPQPKSVPTLWKWKRIEPFVRRAPQLVSAEKAARRVVMLVNPGRKEWSAAVGLLYTGVQVMNPGEFTSAHRHQASALRFIMEGCGAYTVVDGEKMTLGRPPRPGAHAERHLARPWRGSRRLAMRLAGRPRHSPDERARRQLLRGSSGHGAEAGQSSAARRLEQTLFASNEILLGSSL